MLNPKNGNKAAEQINAAYGLVQGVYGDADMNSDNGYAKWNDPAIQAAAMSAAEIFIAAIEAAQKLTLPAR